MFAALFFERDPLRWSDAPVGLILWLQAAGGFAAPGLILWTLLALPRWRKEDRDAVPTWQAFLFFGSFGLSLLLYVVFFLLLMADSGPPVDIATGKPTRTTVVRAI